MSSQNKAKLYTQYPGSSILIYNGATVFHFALGGLGILLGLSFSPWASQALAIIYLVFAFGEMYLLMPLVVCPNCVYVRRADGRCISGMNIVSRRIARIGDVNQLAKRAEGILCPNNLYLVSLIAPILIALITLVVNFSWGLLLVAVTLIGLMLFRFFVIFPKLACLHCAAKFHCPQAAMMGVREL